VVRGKGKGHGCRGAAVLVVQLHRGPQRHNLRNKPISTTEEHTNAPAEAATEAPTADLGISHRAAAPGGAYGGAPTHPHTEAQPEEHTNQHQPRSTPTHQPAEAVTESTTAGAVIVLLHHVLVHLPIRTQTYTLSERSDLRMISGTSARCHSL
jgi:hypothetical protein